MRRILLALILAYFNEATASEIIWESNFNVRRIENKSQNNFVVASVTIDLNKADKQDLQKLSGIGPKKAEAIISYRLTHGPFKNLNELAKIKGFSKKIFLKILEKNKGVLTVSTPNEITSILNMNRGEIAFKA